ncbi:MAG: GNAT family N-acetyltransferase, partial [Bacteroidota bacterium]
KSFRVRNYPKPKFGGQGLGKQAMHHIIEQLRQAGKAALYLCVIDTNDNAIAFYQKLGFQFHSKTRLEALYFRAELRGMHRMCLLL